VVTVTDCHGGEVVGHTVGGLVLHHVGVVAGHRPGCLEETETEDGSHSISKIKWPLALKQ
jgi:hypothetical protein